MSIEDQIENPYFMEENGIRILTLEKNIPANTELYTPRIQNPENFVLTYSLSGADAIAFTINATNGVVTILNNTDYETKPFYTFTVTVMFDTNKTISQTVDIIILMIINEVFNTCFIVNPSLFKIRPSTNNIQINLSDIQQILSTTSYNINLYNLYINVISNTYNSTFELANNTKNLILKNILSNIIKSNNNINQQPNLDIIINKNILPSISSSIIRADSIKLISSLSTTINSLNLLRVQYLYINSKPSYPVMVVMDIEDSIQIVYYGKPLLYIKKKSNGYEVRELNSGFTITNNQEGILYEINQDEYIFKYILGSLLFEFFFLSPPPKGCTCPAPAIPKQGISFGGNLNIPGHEETQAFRTSYQLINSLYIHGGRTEFYNAQEVRCKRPPPRNTFG